METLSLGPKANAKAWKRKHQAFYDSIKDTTECVTRGGAKRTRQLYAERMLTIKEGERPEGKIVRHLCRNDSNTEHPCCNPNHVTWGTFKENTADILEAGNLNSIRTDHPHTNLHTCPHCGKVGKGMVMMRWHFDNCRSLRDV